MEDTSRLIEEIINREWQMFTNVKNKGGRASCQDDRRTFDIMRKSQFVVWGKEALESWLEDLMEAEATERNLVAEKYGYMMHDTAPEEYEHIKALLPTLPKGKQILVDQLAIMQVIWREVVSRDYPQVGNRGRALRKEDAAPGETSLETYARGELSTYSMRTLMLLRRQFQKLEEDGKNPGLCILEEMVCQYGYQSIEDAEVKLEMKEREDGIATTKKLW